MWEQVVCVTENEQISSSRLAIYLFLSGAIGLLSIVLVLGWIGLTSDESTFGYISLVAIGALFIGKGFYGLLVEMYRLQEYLHGQ